jgi:integrase/recombinase XerD
MLVKFKRGRTWYVRGTVKVGERKKSVYESSGLHIEKEAEIFRARLESRLIDELLYGEKQVKTFQDAMISYGESGGSPRYMAQLNGKFGPRRLCDITQSGLDAAAHELFPNTLPLTRNRQCHAPFIAVWNHAVRNGWAELRKWQRPRKEKGTNVVHKPTNRSGSAPTSYDTAARFVASMSPAPAMVMTALFYTGMRPIELFTLQAGDVNVDKRWLVVTASKTGEPRGVPIHDFLVPLLEALLQRPALADDDRLFRTHKGEPYPAGMEYGGGIAGAVIGARKRSGIKGVSAYTGRHTVSTQLVVNGIHPYVKDQILGHVADDMSRRYTNIPQAPLIEAINSLPVPDVWRALPWHADPLAWSRRLIEWGDPAKRSERKVA